MPVSLKAVFYNYILLLYREVIGRINGFKGKIFYRGSTRPFWFENLPSVARVVFKTTLATLGRFSNQKGLVDPR